MLPYKRSQRVSDLIREEIADIIMNKVKDPRLGFVTVTGAKITEDLKIATIYLSILKEEEKEATLEMINSAKGFIRAELAKRLKMKFIPALTFRIDESLEYGNRIEKLLKEIKKEH
ncbi:MAG: 30S ribosome-binding factor RbfA [Nitrospiraceae bacterium]|nr:MAG: 30S ribosome-binding factor RbfA [Nitrospiraceae bacterium]